MLTSFLLGTSKQTGAQTDTLCLFFFPSRPSHSLLGFPAQWRVLGLLTSSHAGGNTPCRLPFGLGASIPPHIYFLTVWRCVSNPSLRQWKEEYSQCHVTQTFPVHPHRNIVPLRAQGGESPTCFVPGTNCAGSAMYSQACSLWKHSVCLCVCVFVHVGLCVLKFVFDPAVLGMPGATTGREWRKSARAEGGKGEEGAAYGGGYLLWNSWVPTPFCFWNTIVWYLVDPPSAFVSVSAHFAF